MTEADEADLLGDEPTGVELTQDEIDTLLDEPTGQESSNQGEPSSNLSEPSTPSNPEEVIHTSADYSVNDVDNNEDESVSSLLDNEESNGQQEETENNEQLEENGNDTLENNDNLDHTIAEEENNEVTDTTTPAEEKNDEATDPAALVLPTESAEAMPTQIVEENGGVAQNGEVPFSMDDLLKLDEDDDQMNEDDDVCLLEPPMDNNDCNGSNLKRTTSSIDDDISVPALDNPTKKRRLHEEEIVDDDVLVEEVPLRLPNQPAPKFNRLGQQMIRCVIEKFRKENPEAVLSTYMVNELKKCNSGLRGMGKKLKEMSTICTNQMEELNKRWQDENQQLRAQVEKLTTINKQLTRLNVQKAAQRHVIPPTPQRHFSTPLPQALSSEKRKEPVGELRTPRNNGITGDERSPSVRTPGNDGLADRINILIPLVLEPRLCYVDKPFDSLPLRNYPASMEKTLKRGITNVQVIINTAYDDFIGTKKLHGQIRYAIPKGIVLEEQSLVRLYYWIESIHGHWNLSPSAKIFPSGITKFNMSFKPEQVLFQGDRISFFAFLAVNNSNKFVSGQVTYNLRKPVIKEQTE